MQGLKKDVFGVFRDPDSGKEVQVDRYTLTSASGVEVQVNCGPHNISWKFLQFQNLFFQANWNITKYMSHLCFFKIWKWCLILWKVISYGACVSAILVPDKSGTKEHVTLGFDDMKG